MLKSVLENQLIFGLLVILIFIILMLPFELIPKLKNNKKIKVIVMISLVMLSVIIFISYAIILNPKVEVTIRDTYVQFKADEKVYFDNIEKIKYLDNVDREITVNGFRWGNDDYYSGDANIKIFDKGSDEDILSLYKAKIYINKNVDSYIVITRVTPYQSFVFNYSTEEKTKEVFQQLDEKCSFDK